MKAYRGEPQGVSDFYLLVTGSADLAAQMRPPKPQSQEEVLEDTRKEPPSLTSDACRPDLNE